MPARIPRIFSLVGTALLLPACAAAAPYTIVDLGDLPGTTQPLGAISINNRGQVTGHTYIGGSHHAFLWSPAQPNGPTGSMIDLGVISDPLIYINSLGQVAFNGGLQGVGGEVAFLWTPSTPNGSSGSAVPAVSTTFPSSVLGLNDIGQMVGRMYPGTAFFWTPLTPNGSSGVTNVYQAFGSNGPYWGPGYGNFGAATAINNAGQVAGYAIFDFYGRAFIHQNPPASFPPVSPYDFGTIAPADLLEPFQPNNQEGASGLGSINASGHGAGSRVFANSLGQVCKLPVYWDGSSFRGIGTACSYTANAINNHDMVVGQTLLANANGESGGFLYANGVMTELRTLIDPSLGWRIVNATGINDAGQIVGVGNHNGSIRPFLMTPEPVPVDVSSQVLVNPLGRRCVKPKCWQTMVLTNNGANSVNGPLSLVINFSGPGVTLANASGTTSVITPAGRPYIDAPVVSLAPGASVNLNLVFDDPSGNPFSFTKQVLAGPGKR